MRAAIEKREKIQTFLEIVTYSGQSIEFNVPGQSTGIFGTINGTMPDDHLQYVFATNEKPPQLTGTVTIRVVSLQYRFSTVLIPLNKDLYSFKIPHSLKIHDLRRCPRIPLKPTPTNRITITLNADDEPFDGVILNVSASGIAINVPPGSLQAYPEQLIHLQGRILDMPFEARAEVIANQDSIWRCAFKYIDKTLQQNLLNRIWTLLNEEIDDYYQELKSSTQQVQILDTKVASRQEKELETHATLVQLIKPIEKATIAVFSEFLGTSPTKKAVRFESISTGIYDYSAELPISGSVYNGSIFLCLKASTLHQMARDVINPDVSQNQAIDFAGEIVNMIAGNAKKFMPEQAHFQLGIPVVISGTAHVLAAMSPYRVVRVLFGSPVGSFDINILLNDLVKENPERSSRFTRFVFERDLFNPIIDSTETIFSQFLKLNPRKMSIQMQDQFASKFETSIIQNIFSQNHHGKLMMSVSDKLAFGIHELLLEEKADEMKDSVKDALSEILNMITGNAKSAFSKHGLNYHLSLPYAICGRNHIVKNAGKAPFISSLYNTKQGFFEISFTLLKKK